MKIIAYRNIRIQGILNLFSGFTFLVPIITLFYSEIGLTLFQILFISNIGLFSMLIVDLPSSAISRELGKKFILRISILSNFISALLIFLFPNFIGLSIASLFLGICWGLWSGVGQQYLSDNLNALNKRNKFGETIGRYIYYEQLALLVSPLIASFVLYQIDNIGFKLLAFLDVCAALIMLFLVYQLEFNENKKISWSNFKRAITDSYKSVLRVKETIYDNVKLGTIMLYRSFSTHALFLPIVILPVLSTSGMPGWISGLVISLATLASMLTSKYTHFFGEKLTYHFSWVFSTTIQGVCLILCGIFVNNWIVLALLFILFNLMEGIWIPSWNEVVRQESNVKDFATIRSFIFSAFVIYAILLRQFLSIFEVEYSLIGLGLFILLINLSLGKIFISFYSSTIRRKLFRLLKFR